jgi:hypothetical protein
MAQVGTKKRGLKARARVTAPRSLATHTPHAVSIVAVVVVDVAVVAIELPCVAPVV